MIKGQAKEIFYYLSIMKYQQNKKNLTAEPQRQLDVVIETIVMIIIIINQ